MPLTAEEQDGKTVITGAQDEVYKVGLVAAQRFLEQGKAAEARKVLDQLHAHFPRDNQVEFLLGLLAMAEGNYAEAQRLFRRILVRDPGAVRVRLELGRAFFLEGDDANARFNFRLALADNQLPEAVRANVDTYLAAIRQRRNWTLEATFAIAPDSNINSAPTIQTVDIFGLPFDLDPNARQTSGVGVIASLGGEYRQPVNEWLAARFGARAHRADYEGVDFDDQLFEGFLGPRVSLGPWDVSLLATGSYRTYALDPLNKTIGARLEVRRDFGPELSLQLSLEQSNVTYFTNNNLSGPLTSLFMSGSYGLSTTSFIRALAFGNRQEARSASFSNSETGFAVGYYKDLPYGFSFYVQPGLTRTRYDAGTAIFPETRRDLTWQVRTNILNRRFDFHGFSPMVGYVFQERASTVDFYDYTRHRFEIGVTRVF